MVHTSNKEGAAVRSARRWGVYVILGSLLAGSGPAAAADDRVVVRLEEGQSLRDLAERHLGDPDLWMEILRANNLAVSDVRPGIEIEIPVSRIAAADRALQTSLETIQKATSEGARLFAPDEMAQAIWLRDTALAHRKAGEWDEAAKVATDASATADRALAAALAQRDSAAEALLSDRHGWVEGQRPEDVVWSDRDLNSVLIEEEKVRTLSRSTAQVTFRDDSRLRLNPNSQAVIQRMRVDPLSREEEAKVTLVEGDLYALLSGKSARKTFGLEIPDVETEIDSTSFWVRHDASGSKFANYDDGALQVAAEGESVTLGRNEGTVVRSGQAPSEKMDVLVGPVLVAPQDDAVAYRADLELQWAPVGDAAGYWVEVAVDPSFAEMTLSQWGLKDTSFHTEDLDVGPYYWRVAALDKFGLPGARSPAWRFNVSIDVTPPYLAINAPAEGAILRDATLEVVGESEPAASVTLNGGAVALGPDGRFQAAYQPAPGLNEIVLAATDSAGNATERRRSFVFMPDEAAAVVFDPTIPSLGPREFVTDQDVISLAGSAAPDAQILMLASDGSERASAYTDGEGRFRINVPVREPGEEFDLQMITTSGFTTKDHFSVSIDQEGPAIELDEPPPPVTAVEWLPLRGFARGAAEVLLNGRSIKLLDDSFDETVTLRTGANGIEMVATDLVGNVRVERWEVALDQEPPELLGHSLSSERADPGQPFVIEVEASDASGLKQAAPFTVQIGGTTYSDFLRLNPATGSYRTTVVPPQGASGRLALTDVELEDYAGNTQRYSFK
jgi:FecR protein/Glucodextranase, domain B